MRPSRKENPPYNETPTKGPLIMNKLAIVKKAVNLVVGAGATRIVAGIIANNTAPTKLTDKVAILAAAFVLGSIAAEIMTKYTDTKIDELAQTWKENVTKKIESSES